MRCDLHLHTCRSDGAHATNDVLCMARRARLDLISITDHDSVEAYADIDPEAQGDLQLIRGVEITTALPDGHEMHILGYFPRGFTRRFRDFLRRTQEQRRERMRVSVDRLRALGLDIALDDVLERCGGRVISRAHLARTLVDKQCVATYADAFKQYIGSQRHVVPRPKVGPREAINVIRRERGISIWAHPSPDRIDEWLPKLKTMGINGVEAYARRWGTTAELPRIEAVAREARMLTAGGSDWHGHHERDQLGNYVVPADSIRQFLSFFDLS